MLKRNSASQKQFSRTDFNNDGDDESNDEGEYEGSDSL